MNRDEVTLCRSRVHSIIDEYHERTAKDERSDFKPYEKIQGGAFGVSDIGEQPDIDDDSEQHGNGLYMGIKKLVRLFGVDV